MDPLLTFTGAVKRDERIDEWFEKKPAALSSLVRPWFERMRACGDDVLELMHDGMPTACVGEVPWACVNVFSAHANVGFFYGAELSDRAGWLEGSGKRMRHVKLKPGAQIDNAALGKLVDAAYADVHKRIRDLGKGQKASLMQYLRQQEKG